jgi:hypothetical protein
MLSRFGQGVCRAEKLVPWWPFDLFEREMIGIELDMFKNKQFASKMIVRAQESSASATSTSTRVLHVEDKALKANCDNAVCISVAMSSQQHNKVLCKLIMIAAEGGKNWRVDMTKRTRNA